MQVIYQSIGVIHSPYTSITDMPIQPSGAAGVRGRIELAQEWIPALKDLDGFSHLILLYHFHLVRQSKLEVTPFLDTQPHGLFATHAPQRPNPIGLSVVKLLSITDNQLFIENVDILDGTPLLDIKPFVPEFEPADDDLRLGWLEKRAGDAKTRRSDDRFQG